MENKQIIETMISNLKGRRNYEERKATRLGFANLHDYLEDKIMKQKMIEIEEAENLEQLKPQKINNKNKEVKSSCGCC
ncbi:hypothetical protein OAK17_08685 [Alphaproteobacteria bacterium]|nr:hypothetical protein [Alphaproteobacteria bacterium]